jgi:cadmium resistance protein CadD (predicted permease)
MGSLSFIVLGATDAQAPFGFSIALIAIGAFVSTNLDDLFLLASLFVDSEFRTLPVVVGQFLGMSFLVVISILAAFFAMAIQTKWIPLLGLIPLLLGISRLCGLFKRVPGTTLTRRNGPEFFGKEQLRFRWARSETALATLLTVANGGDNLTVYIPLFSIQRAFIPLFVIIFLMMTGLWCLLGYSITGHKLFGSDLKRYGRLAVPFILIGIGLNVLLHL